jgi:hypothetical protein
MNKDKIIQALRTDVKKFNRWRQLYKIEKLDLSNANLSYANLEDANLKYANLSYANLEDANLSNANLYNANLKYANLYNANLKYANLSNANLYNANLEDANLEDANLSNANLYNANLKYANLKNANLEDVKGKTILSISGIGSSKRQTTYNVTDDYIQCGCFRGTFQDFIRKIKEAYKKEELYYKQYKKAVIYLFWQGRLNEVQE